MNRQRPRVFKLVEHIKAVTCKLVLKINGQSFGYGIYLINSTDITVIHACSADAALGLPNYIVVVL